MSGPGDRGHRTEPGRHREEPRVLDPPPGVLVDPVDGREPEDDPEQDPDVPRDVDRARGDQVVGGGDHGQRRSLPRIYPAANAAPTIASTTNAANPSTAS